MAGQEVHVQLPQQAIASDVAVAMIISEAVLESVRSPEREQPPEVQRQLLFATVCLRRELCLH